MNEQHPQPRMASYMSRFLPAENAGAAGQGSTISFQSLRATIWRQRFIWLGVVLAVLLAGLLYTLLATPMFKATSTVRMEFSGAQIIEGQELIDPYVPYNQHYLHMDTQMQILASRDMALQVVEDLGLEDDPAFDEELGLDAALTGEPRKLAIAQMLQDSLELELLDFSQILAISSVWPDAAIAARIANGYAESYVEYDYRQSVEAATYAQDFLENEIASLRERLNDREAQAIQYARANRIIGDPVAGGRGSDDEESGTARTLTASSLAQINAAYAEARAGRIAAEQRWRAVSGVPAAELPEVQRSVMVQQMQGQLAQALARLADLRERYREEYPDVEETQVEVDALRERIATTGAEIKAGIRRDYEVARRQEAALRNEVETASTASLDEQDRRVEYSQLDREVASLRAQLATLLERRNQVVTAANVQRSAVTPLDAAQVPEKPDSPKPLRNMFVALVLGIGLAGVIALLREILDDRLRSTEDVERKLGLPAIGQTPHLADFEKQDLATPFNPISESYSSVRATLDFVLAGSNDRVIQFTSSQPSEGKTTSCYAAALKFASVGKKVLMIDFDLRRPSLHKQISDGRPETGVVDVVYDRVSLDEALVKTDHPLLDLLPASGAPDNPSEVLSSALIAELFASVRERYDLVLVDSSPVLGIADAPLLSRFVDGVVFIVEANRSHARRSRMAIERLRDVDANILGAIVTKFRALEVGESYRYNYRYYRYETQN